MVSMYDLVQLYFVFYMSFATGLGKYITSFVQLPSIHAQTRFVPSPKDEIWMEEYVVYFSIRNGADFDVSLIFQAAYA